MRKVGNKDKKDMFFKKSTSFLPWIPKGEIIMNKKLKFLMFTKGRKPYNKIAKCKLKEKGGS